MRDPDAAQAITAALWRAMLERGRGTVKQTEKAIGFRADGLRGAKNCKGGLRLRHVTDAIEALGIPPSVFFNDALGGGISTTAAERFMARGAELAARNLVELPDLADDVQPDRLTEDDLARLDAARFEDPHAAADQAADVARQAARDGRRGDAVAAVARQGSALRVAEMWEPAWVCIWWTLRHAPDGPIKGDALRRSVSVVADFGLFQDAADLAGAAGVEYMESGDVAGVGRALLGCGTFLRKAGDFTGACCRLEAAVAFLPKDDHTSHFAVHQNLGLASVDLGDLARARRHAEAAARMHNIPVALDRALKWLAARIAAAGRDYDLAIRMYGETIDSLEHSPGDAALASAELCRSYLRARRTEEAIHAASLMARLALPRDQNQVVAAAILDLYRSAKVGKLTLDFVDHAIVEIRRGLEQRAVAISRPVVPRA